MSFPYQFLELRQSERILQQAERDPLIDTVLENLTIFFGIYYSNGKRVQGRTMVELLEEKASQETLCNNSEQCRSQKRNTTGFPALRTGSHYSTSSKTCWRTGLSLYCIKTYDTIPISGGFAISLMVLSQGYATQNQLNRSICFHVRSHPIG